MLIYKDIPEKLRGVHKRKDKKMIIIMKF